MFTERAAALPFLESLPFPALRPNSVGSIGVTIDTLEFRDRRINFFSPALAHLLDVRSFFLD